MGLRNAGVAADLWLVAPVGIYGPALSGPWKTVEDVELATLGWGCSTGTTPAAYTATSRTFPRPSTKPRSTMHNGPANHWPKSNSSSLRGTQAFQSVGCSFGS